MAATKAQGTTLKFTPPQGQACTVGKLTSVGEIQTDSEELDVTTLDTQSGYREYIQGFRDAGEVEISGYHDKGDTGQKALRQAYEDGGCCPFQVNFPDGAKVSFNAFVKGYSVGSAEVDGAIGFGATLRISGGVQVTEVEQ